ncbi:MAG: DNA polymerase III subunit alpha [Rikenellaceae bacterium]
MFTHLHVHTQYSILDGAANIKKLIARAKSLGQTSLAITDHGNMFGVKEFHDEATKAGIKPLLGCEVYVAENSRFSKSTKEDRGGYHLILLAKNEMGYKNLIKLVSYAWIEGYYYNPRIDKELLEKYHHGLICCSACLGGEIPQYIMAGELDKASETIEWFKSLFGEDYYLEMQLHRSGFPTIDAKVYENQQLVNTQILKLAQKHSVKYIATNDVHYILDEDAPAHDRLICLSTGRDFDDPKRMRYTTQEFLKSEEEMLSLFPNNPEALLTTQEIVDKIEEYSLSHRPYMPNFPLPDDFKLDFEKVQRSILMAMDKDGKGDPEVLALVTQATSLDQLSNYAEYTTAIQHQYLIHLTYEGARVRWGKKIPQDVIERIDFELKTIEWMGFPGYFLIVWDFIRAAREIGVSVGPGRGSAAGSVVAYCLKITNIDPVKYDLLFERFLNPERISMPDVDIDFDEDGREKVLHYVVEKYGQKRVAHIITFGTMAAKSSIKDVARIHKLPLAESIRLAKMVPEKPGTTLDGAYKDVPELAKERKEGAPLVVDTLKYAEKLEGTVRSTGVHACGVIIGADDLENFIPMSTAKDAELYVVQFEGNKVEDVGLLKMDFLGLKTLSIIKDAVENVKISKGKEIDIEKIPLTDKKTFALYANGETTGLFQFESPGMKKHLRALIPNRFEDLIAMNALYRPGPMEYIPNFIARKHGREPIVYDLPDMQEYLSDTYGITVYQEQVMLLSQKLAGFTKGQADTLRKAMGKKQRAVLDKMKPKFIEGAAAKGHDSQVCEKIWKDWEAFAQYAFNKSHSTCYAYISYQTAYMKAHYPAEFMAALLSRNLSDMTKLAFFMDECKRMGTPVLSPDVNKSYHRFAVDAEGYIRFGMGGIKGVGENAVSAIIAERKANGNFKDLYDFVERVPLQTVNKKNIECLALAGAFDSIWQQDRSLLLVGDDKEINFIEHLVRYGNLYQADKAKNANSLFGDMLSSSMVHKPQLMVKQTWDRLFTLDREKEVVGIYLSGHPLDNYRMLIENYFTHTMSDLQDLIPLHNKDIIVGGIVTEVKNLVSGKGAPYGRFLVEDFSGNHEFTLFGKEWENYRMYCQPQSSILIRARVTDHPFHPDQMKLSFNSMKSLYNILEEDVKNINIAMSVVDLTHEKADVLIEAVCSNPGKVNLVINIFDSSDEVSVQLRSERYKVAVNNSLGAILDQYQIKYTLS